MALGACAAQPVAPGCPPPQLHAYVEVMLDQLANARVELCRNGTCQQGALPAAPQNGIALPLSGGGSIDVFQDLDGPVQLDFDGIETVRGDLDRLTVADATGSTVFDKSLVVRARAAPCAGLDLEF